ncbi:MAG: hypothetical protein ACYDD1_18665 [Caulobacteraceae bacterium]
MSYLDERETEESLETQVARFQPRPNRERDPDLLAVAAEVGKGRGFSRAGADDAGGSPTDAPSGRGEAPKRKQVSRRARGAQKTDAGQITLTGPFDTLDRLVRRATWDRLTYVGLIARMLDLYEERHGPVPPDFVP